MAASTVGSVFIPLATLGNDDAATSVLVQADGKIITAGYAYNSASGSYDFAICRRSADGTADLSFGAGTGQALIPVGSAEDRAYSAALQADGKIVLAGYSYVAATSTYDFSVARLNSDGSLDSSFGSGTGKALLAVSSTATAYAMTVQSDGKLVLAGYSYSATGTTGDDFTVMRLNANGSLDSTFGMGWGSVILSHTGTDFGRSVSVQSDGKIVLAGTLDTGQFGVARLNSNGSLDTSFGASGYATIAVGSYGVASVYGSTLQTDGKILLVGLGNNDATNNKSFAVVRLTSDGGLDSSFGSGTGKVFVPIGDMDNGRSIAVQTDGKILLAGYTRVDPQPYVTGTTEFAVMRLNSNGTLDSSFGQGGKVTAYVGSSNAEAYSLALQSDGKIVVAGQAVNPDGHSGQDFALLRLNTNGSVDSNFGVAASTTITGTAADDFFTSGGSGSHTYDGAGGTDYIAYRNAIGPVVANLTTGSASWINGSDVLISIENVFGSSYNDTLTGNAANNYMVGASGNDSMYGMSGNDTLSGDAGNDLLDGGSGTDTAQYSYMASEYTITKLVNGYSVTAKTGTDGTDTLINIERIKFSNSTLPLDVSANQPTGGAVLLLGAVLPGTLVFAADKQALRSTAIDLFDQGYSLQTLAGAIMRLPIWDVLTGKATPSNTDIATYLLTNVNGAAPSPTTLASAVTALNTETDFASQGHFLAQLAESSANQARVDLVGLATNGLPLNF
jgi:uncharacterized delta-60 repeat protein